MNDTIIAKPANIKPKLSYALCVLICALIGTVPANLLILCLSSSSTPDHHWPLYLSIPVFVATFIPGSLFGLWFARKSINKLYWRLTDTELSCGPSGSKNFRSRPWRKLLLDYHRQTVSEGASTGQTRHSPWYICGCSFKCSTSVECGKKFGYRRCRQRKFSTNMFQGWFVATTSFVCYAQWPGSYGCVKKAM